MRFLVIFLLLNSCFAQDNKTIPLVENVNQKIKVQILGHVNKPGIYVIEKNSSLKSLIEKASGLKSKAEDIKDYLLKDNQTIFINSNEYTNKINLNNCSYQDIEPLKYVNKNVAMNIIDYAKNNKFNSVIDLLKVKGIKEKTFNKIYKYFKV